MFGLVESVITAKPVVRADPDTPSQIADAALRMLGVPPARLERARNRATAFIERDIGADPDGPTPPATRGGRLQVPASVRAADT